MDVWEGLNRDFCFLNPNKKNMSQFGFNPPYPLSSQIFPILVPLESSSLSLYPRINPHFSTIIQNTVWIVKENAYV